MYMKLIFFCLFYTMNFFAGHDSIDTYMIHELLGQTSRFRLHDEKISTWDLETCWRVLQEIREVRCTIFAHEQGLFAGLRLLKWKELSQFHNLIKEVDPRTEKSVKTNFCDHWLNYMDDLGKMIIWRIGTLEAEDDDNYSPDYHFSPIGIDPSWESQTELE